MAVQLLSTDGKPNPANKCVNGSCDANIESNNPNNKSNNNASVNYGINRLMDTQNRFAKKLPPRLVLVTDLDHTLFGGDTHSHSEVESHIQEFNDLWLTKYAPNNCVLVYATGRSVAKYALACRDWKSLMKPDILVSGDGVMIHWFNKQFAQLVQHGSTHKINMNFLDDVSDTQFLWEDKSWDASLLRNWNQSFAEELYREYASTHAQLPMPEGSEHIEPFRIALLVATREEAKAGVRFFEERVAQYNAELVSNVNVSECNTDASAVVESISEPKSSDEWNVINKTDTISPNEDNSNDAIAAVDNSVSTCDDENESKTTEVVNTMDIHTFHCIERGDGGGWWAAMTPAQAGKGRCVDFLRQRFGCESGENFVICGDSGNDISMLSLPRYNAVVVRNSSKELLDFYEKHSQLKGDFMYLSRFNVTKGVIEGLQRFAHQMSNHWPIIE